MPGISQNADNRVVSGVRSLNGSSVWCSSIPLTPSNPIPLALLVRRCNNPILSTFRLPTSNFNTSNRALTVPYTFILYLR